MEPEEIEGLAAGFDLDLPALEAAARAARGGLPDQRVRLAARYARDSSRSQLDGLALRIDPAAT